VENVSTYAKVVTGFKSGGFNLRAGSQLSFESGFDPEKMISYELGLKSRWLDNRLQFNTAVFHMDFDDIQMGIPEPGNPSNVNIFNAGKAKIDGVELELTAVPFEGLLLNLSYAYLDARITEVIDPFGGGDVHDDYVMTSAPDGSLSADLTYTFPKFSLGTLSATVDYSWQDKFFTQGDVTSDGPTYGAYNDAYGLLGARLTLGDIGAGKTKAKISLWGRNLLDEDWGIDTIGSFHGFVADRLVAFGAGRTYGIDIGFEL
jgi:iron complex outermembrane receptor protein